MKLIENMHYKVKSSVNESLFVEKSFTPKDSNKLVKYYRYNNQKFLSVSSIIYTIQEPFDEVAQSILCSIKPNHKHFGKLPAEIIKIWHDKRDKSRMIGMKMDEYIQTIFQGGDILNIEDLYILDGRNRHFDKFKNDIIDEHGLELVSIEDVIYNTDLMVLGIPDAIFILDGYLVIFDWKSNDSIDLESHFKLLPPFDYLDSSKLTIYTIQLYLYKWILESSYNLTVPIKGCRIGHITNVGYNVIKPKFEYNANEIEQIIKFALTKSN